MEINNTNNNDVQNFGEEICVNVQKIYDTCKDKDCLSDMRVYLSPGDQSLIDNAVNIRARKSELVWTSVTLEEVPFNKGFYGVDLTFYFKTGFEVYTGNGRPSIVEGLSYYNKKVILYGSEGNTTTFSSACSNNYSNSNLPVAEVEVVDPIVLNTRIVNPSCNCCCSECESLNLPSRVAALFPEELTDMAGRKLVVSLGLFSVVRIVRDVQVKIPYSRFSLPEKECSGPREEEPCSFFEKLCFPTNEFFPPEGGTSC
ncbi:MAG: hypothetical protein IJ043_07495 [Clostridia bacterium]|nr:hypothetical protein [Clostridia bacterium]